MKILPLIAIFLITGCSSTVQNLRDSDYSQGCVVVEAEAKLGLLNQEGNALACKVKCSKELPSGFKYNYNNIRTGCKIEVVK